MTISSIKCRSPSFTVPLWFFRIHRLPCYIIFIVTTYPVSPPCRNIIIHRNNSLLIHTSVVNKVFDPIPLSIRCSLMTIAATIFLLIISCCSPLLLLVTSFSPQRRNHRRQTTCLNQNVYEEETGYPVQIHQEGHTATIYVRNDEPILHALERQSIVASSSMSIPNECRRGNCLTCSSRVVIPNNNNNEGLAVARQQKNALLANVNNGLSQTVASEVTNSGIILTCCSYITGPGVESELDQNDNVWDLIYRRRICPSSTTARLEAQARLLCRVDEDNVDTWKRKMEENWDSE